MTITDIAGFSPLRLPERFAISRNPYNGLDSRTRGRSRIMYLSGCTNPPTAAAAHSQRRLGMLAQPGNSIHLQAHHYSRWAIDNGAFGKAKRGKPWTDDDTFIFLSYLKRVATEVSTTNVLFAVAPDVLEFVDGAPRGDAQATWDRSREIFPLIRKLGMPVALVAQDGITGRLVSPRRDQWDEFDVLFLGGSDNFKLGVEAKLVTAQAKAHGKWVHMGRVNSLKRLRAAQEMGCDSVDGTFIGFGPALNLPKVLRWLDSTELAATAVAA